MYIDQVMFTLVLVVRRCQSFFFCYHPLDSINFICSFSVFILHLTGDCAQIKMNTIFCNKNTQLFPEGGSHFKWPKVRVHTLGDLSISIWEGRKKNALCEFFCSRRARSTFKWETQTANRDVYVDLPLSLRDVTSGSHNFHSVLFSYRCLMITQRKQHRVSAVVDMLDRRVSRWCSANILPILILCLTLPSHSQRARGGRNLKLA